MNSINSKNERFILSNVSPKCKPADDFITISLLWNLLKVSQVHDYDLEALLHFSSLDEQSGNKYQVDFLNVHDELYCRTGVLSKRGNFWYQFYSVQLS